MTDSADRPGADIRPAPGPFPAGQSPRLPGRARASPPPATSRRRYEPPSWTTDTAGRPFDAVARRPASGHASGLLDRHPDETGPLVEPEWWSYATSDHPGHPLTARHSGRSPRAGGAGVRPARRPGIAPPVGAAPAMPSGVWDRLHSRRGAPLDDAETVAQPLVPGGPAGRRRAGPPSRATSPRTTTPRPTPSTPAPGRTRRAGSTSSGPTSRRSRPAASDAAPAARPPSGRGRRRAVDAGEDLDGATTSSRRAGLRRHDPDGLVHDERLRGVHPRQALRPARRPHPAAPAAGRRPGLAAGAGRARRRHRPRRAEAAHADRPVLARLQRAGHRRDRHPGPATATRSATSPGPSSTPASSPRSARSSRPPRPTPTPSASSPVSTPCGSR